MAEASDAENRKEILNTGRHRGSSTENSTDAENRKETQNEQICTEESIYGKEQKNMEYTEEKKKSPITGIVLSLGMIELFKLLIVFIISLGKIADKDDGGPQWWEGKELFSWFGKIADLLGISGEKLTQIFIAAAILLVFSIILILMNGKIEKNRSEIKKVHFTVSLAETVAGYLACMGLYAVMTKTLGTVFVAAVGLMLVMELVAVPFELNRRPVNKSKSE